MKNLKKNIKERRLLLDNAAKDLADRLNEILEATKDYRLTTEFTKRPELVLLLPAKNKRLRLAAAMAYTMAQVVESEDYSIETNDNVITVTVNHVRTPF